MPEEDVAVCSSALAPGNSRPVRTSAEGQQNTVSDGNPLEALCVNPPDTETRVIVRTTGDGSKIILGSKSVVFYVCV